LEPSPINVELLKKNVAANRLDTTIQIEEKAIAGQNGTMQLLISGYSNLNTTYRSKLVDGKQIPFLKTIEVEAVTIDDYLKDKRAPELIKMDIEGAEVEVVKGMQRTLGCTRSMSLFIEIHPQLLDNTAPMLDFLRTLMLNGFETLAVISHDDFYRNIAGIARVEHLSIMELITDPRVTNGTTAFEVFFHKR
ncbi:MAG: FkbM family methyltransferase, partial [Chitinivibrionales bacterium]|nr:FkbM family methyltransferase [Chitinivibrionales bacterium]MBD3395107.1 FkbM family methyltransferase [Chitinivibrionales bacterium]